MMKGIFKLYIFKLVILSLTMIFISFGANAHSLNGVYECKTSSWSPFKTEVEIKNFKKHYDARGKLGHYTADVYFDDKKPIKAYKNFIIYDGHYYFKKSKKEQSRVVLRHNTASGEWDVEGIKYIHQEKEFSENTGSKWVTKRSVFCEKQ